MLIANTSSGILIPIPQYPLYSATLAQRRGVPIPYYMDETKGWSTEPAEVERAVVEAKAKGTDPKALVVVNPGNPTGSVLAYDTQRELVDICAKHNLVILADEVYQTNLHDPENYPFISFKKVLMDSQSDVPLISFHSISKGVTGECGRRGGYFECANVPEDVIALIYKMVALDICPPVSGQIGVDCLVRPPAPGEPSYELWKSETDCINAALAKRTNFMAERFNKLPGVTCAPAPGALYLFPKLHLPLAAIQAAKDAGKVPDAFYCMARLEETGICAVPGSGFGQKEGEAHFRLTCLCEAVEDYMEKFEKFQRAFWKKYGGSEE
jgi:alanine transaminase